VRSECGHCGSPSPGVYLCHTCVLALRIDLADVAGIIPTPTTHLDGQRRGGHLPSLPDDLNTTMARADQLSDPSERSGRRTSPLVFKPRAAESLWVLHHTLVAWATDLGGSCARLTTPQIARWMLAHLTAVQRCPQAAQLYDEVIYACHQARAAIDRPDDPRVFLGPCGTRQHYPNGTVIECTTEVYGVPWREQTTCEGCGTVHTISRRQEWLRERLRHYLGTAPEVAGFLRVTGVDCTAEMIRGYAHRKRVTPAGYNSRGHPLYLISDVLAAIRDRYHRRAP
jgi:hypothetical protein